MHACLYKKHFCSFNSLAQSCSHVGALLIEMVEIRGQRHQHFVLGKCHDP